MGFHYGYEKRKFDAEWTRLEQEYRAASMDDRQIAAMKEYDWSWFCSQRTYLNRVQALPSEQYEDESEQSSLLRKFESLSCTWDTSDVDETALSFAEIKALCAGDPRIKERMGKEKRQTSPCPALFLHSPTIS